MAFLYFSASPVGFWPLTNHHGGSDLSGNGNHAHLHEALSAFGPDSTPGGAFRLAGNDQSYIKIPNDGSLAVEQSFTLMLQVLPDINDNQALFEYYDAVNNKIGVYSDILMNRTVEFTVTERGKLPQLKNRVNDVAFTRSWNFISFVHRVEGASASTSVYRDRTMQDLAVLSSILHVETQAGYDLYLGKNQRNRGFSGRIACVQLYNVSLNEDEMEEAWDRCNYTVPQPLGLWPFSLDFLNSSASHASTLINDLSGNNNHARVTGISSAHPVFVLGPNSGDESVQLITNSYAVIQNRNGLLNMLPTFTFLAYVYAKSGIAIDRRTILKYGSRQNATGLEIYLNEVGSSGGANMYHLKVDFNPSFVSKPDTPVEILLDMWYFIGITFDVGGNLKVWLDDDEQVIEEIGAVDLQTDFDIYLGGVSTEEVGFYGAFSCIQLYRQPLTFQQVRDGMEMCEECKLLNSRQI